MNVHDTILRVLALPEPVRWTGRPAKRLVQTGCCRYCGQSVALPIGGALSAQDAEELATADCRCGMACAARKINERFGDGARYPLDDGTVDFLINCVKALRAGDVDQLTIKVTDTVQAKLGYGSKGNLSIRRRDAIETKDEV